MTSQQISESSAVSGRRRGLVPLVYAACDTVTWMALLNVGWLLGAALGGIVLGVGPATAAAYTLARRRLRGDGVRFVRDFWAAYRSEWRRANAVFAPVVVVAISLAFLCTWATDSHAPWPVGVLLGVVVVLTVGIAGTLAPMYAHYELPWHRYVVMASRFALRAPWTIVLVAGLAGLVVAATTIIPALLWFLSIGVWIQLDMALGLALFTTNDRRIETSSSPAQDTV